VVAKNEESADRGVPIKGRLQKKRPQRKFGRGTGSRRDERKILSLKRKPLFWCLRSLKPDRGNLGKKSGEGPEKKNLDFHDP